MIKSTTHSTPTTPTSDQTPRAHSGVTTFENRSVKVIRSVTIRRPANELYAFCKDTGNLSKILRQPSSVSREDAHTSSWSIALSGNQRAECRVQIINDHPGEMLAWSSLEGADIACAGTLRFEKAIGDRGTEIIATLEYEPARGKLAAAFESISGLDVGQQLGAALNRFKDLVESGEMNGSGTLEADAGNPS
jgi:uncharacterized membrane protein